MDASNAYTVPDNHNIAWIGYQLANDHGIERTESEIYWQVFNDAGRNEFTAGDMLYELAENKTALSSFAQSINCVQPRVRIKRIGPTPESVFLLVTIALLIGFLAGIWI